MTIAGTDTVFSSQYHLFACKENNLVVNTGKSWSLIVRLVSALFVLLSNISLSLKLSDSFVFQVRQYHFSCSWQLLSPGPFLLFIEDFSMWISVIFSSLISITFIGDFNICVKNSSLIWPHRSLIPHLQCSFPLSYNSYPLPQVYSWPCYHWHLSCFIQFFNLPAIILSHSHSSYALIISSSLNYQSYSSSFMISLILSLFFI